MTDLLQRLRERKLVQWAVAYVAFAFASIQGLDVIAQQFGWPESLRRGITLALVVGFFLVLVLAWYHGERGAQKVSGTEIAILALLLAIGGGLLWRYAHNMQSIGTTAITAVPAKAPEKSIAVLPFVNMSGDPKEDYFSDGITEEILNALAQTPDLQVAARTSAFAFKGKNEDLRKIGAALGVAHVLEGSVQRAGNEVRITAQLIDTRSGYHLWSEKYDRPFDNVFAVEDEISKAIADKLQAQMNTGSSANAGTSDPRAHELYLRGLTLLAARGPGLRIAADTFRQAVTVDPKYAQAWAGLAQAQVLVHNWRYDSEGNAMHEADTAVQRALQLDPDLAAAHVALGILHDERWQWADAAREFRRALELAPNDAEALDQYAQFLQETGNPQASLPLIERANRLDPLSGLIGSVHAQVLQDLRRWDAAKAQIDRTLSVAPDGKHARGVAISIMLDRKDYTAAQAQVRAYAPLADRDPEIYVALVRGIADPAQRADAFAALARLDTVGIEIARWRILLGDRAGALRELETWFGGVPVGGAFQLWGATFAPIRDDPRFKAVLKHMGLPYTPSGTVTP